MSRDPDTPDGAEDTTSPVLDSTNPPPRERRIGVYRIVRELGHGGMGTVLLGVRADQLYHKPVAIKVVRAPDSAEVLRRFHQERRILASLDHPNVAKLFDGGTTEEGLPYFVMEYVEGQPIGVHCDRHGLDTAGRLRLFQHVCAAVQYAHRNLVVHRDLKPANILVSAEGAVKLLDFGIAKLLNPELSADGLTGTQLALTPEYASPEQARSEPITTASDVYSLGVVLYELLTGRRPYRFKSRQTLDVLRAVVDQEAARPSTAVGRTEAADVVSPGTTPESISRTREGTPERLRRRLRGDVDNILLMALRKEPNKRYASAEALSEDIARHLNGHPVSARSATVGYRARKFVTRHALALVSFAAVFLLIVASATTAWRQAVRTRLAYERAERERVKAEAVSAFLIDLFKVSDPSEALGKAITAREVLDKGAERIARELRDQPEVRATLLDTLGNVYRTLGEYDRAIALLEEALAIRRRMFGKEHAAVATTLSGLGEARFARGDFGGAVEAHSEALAVRRRVLAGDHQEVAGSLRNLSSALQQAEGEFERIASLLLEAADMQRRLFGPDHPEVAATIAQLGAIRREQGNYSEAERLSREALRIRKKVFGDEHPIVTSSLNNLAAVHMMAGRLPEAEALFREALDRRVRLLGPEHPQVATSMNNLAAALSEQDKLGEAEQIYRGALRIMRKTLADDNPRVFTTRANICEILARRGRLAEAEKGYAEVLEAGQRTLAPTHTVLRSARLWLGLIRTRRGHAQRGEPLLREALAAVRQVVSAGGRPVALAETGLAECLVAQRRYEEAEAMLLRSEPVLRAARRSDYWHRLSVAQLVALYEGSRRPEKAAAYRGSVPPP